MPRQCVWGIAKHRVGVGLGRCGNGVCGSDQGLPSFQHAAQHKWRDQPLEEAGPGQEPVKRLGPDVHQVQHKRSVELLGEAGGRLGAVERGQAREDDVGPLQLAGRHRLVRQPLEGFPEVAVAADAGQRHVLFVGPHGHQPHGEALVLADPEGGGANRLPAVAPGGGPPDHVVAPGGEHAGERPVTQRRQSLARDVVERVDEPDGKGPGGKGLGSGARHGVSLSKRLPGAE